MVMMMRAWSRSMVTMMVMMRGRSRSVVATMVVRSRRMARLRWRWRVVAAMVVRTWSLCQQLTANRCRRWCVMVTMGVMVMRARCMSMVLVVGGKRVMVLAVVPHGRWNQKQCHHHSHWHSHDIHGVRARSC
jgi:hypothetical protein